MPYVLDGDNLVGGALGRKPSPEDRDALIREIADRLRKTRARAVLHFDGAGTSTSLGSLSVRYAGSESADDAIVREVAKSAGRREAVVVTADRELGRRARDAGARVISPEEFWSRFGTRKEKTSKAEAPVDVDDWERWFSEEENRRR